MIRKDPAFILGVTAECFNFTFKITCVFQIISGFDATWFSNLILLLGLRFY